MKNFILLTGLIATLMACGPSKKEELQTLKDEVLAIHDEVMPKMGELRKTRKGLEALADSLMATDSTQAIKISSLAADISAANEGMMQWMRAFEPEFEGTDEEIQKYLEEQKVAVQKVKDDMNESLESGKKALKE
ncbi:hypothetical protein [Ekhidna sp. To15]|uniref:hypothetical protein n=1 Tax=Ekhidna sp. To15 TaxID=3395267 RepID=UPI003F52495F